MFEMIAAVVVVGVVIGWVDRKLRERPIQGLVALAEALNLKLDPSEQCAVGVISGLEIEVMTAERVAIHVRPARRAASAPRIHRARKGAPTSFDDVYSQIVLDGDHAAVVATFDGASRRALLELLRAGGTIADDVVSYESLKSPENLEELVWKLLDIGACLLVPLDDLAEKLARRALDDPSVPVRRYALQLLVARFPERAEPTLKAAMVDPVPHVRLEAARLLGADGFRELERLVGSTGVPAQVRATALRHLLGALPADRLTRLVLREVGNKRADSALALIAVEELAKLGDTSFGKALIPLLSHASTDVRIAAAMALARVGTRDSIAPLEAVAYATHGVERHLRAAAKAALDAIEDRCASHKRGRVSLAEEAPRAGAVSVAGPAGSLSMTDEE